jgi:hypothetical protein
MTVQHEKLWIRRAVAATKGNGDSDAARRACYQKEFKAKPKVAVSSSKPRLSAQPPLAVAVVRAPRRPARQERHQPILEPIASQAR